VALVLPGLAVSGVAVGLLEEGSIGAVRFCPRVEWPGCRANPAMVPRSRRTGRAKARPPAAGSDVRLPHLSNRTSWVSSNQPEPTGHRDQRPWSVAGCPWSWCSIHPWWGRRTMFMTGC